MIVDLKAKIEDELDGLLRALVYQTGSVDLSEGFRNLRERTFGRYEIVLPWLGPYLASSRVYEHWIPLVRTILGEFFLLHSAGVFLSLPGSAAQHYHTDGPHLDIEQELPCHALNVFLVLTEVGKFNGTALISGSHRLRGGFRRRSRPLPLRLIRP